MAVLPTKTFAEVTQTIAAGVQGRANSLVDFSPGSILLAITHSFSAVVMWLQSTALQLLTITRASTSTGVDLDSWMADFGVTRLGAQRAIGTVTFARFTAGPSAPFIPVGSTVRTADGSQTFEVVASPSVPTYSASLGGYTMPSSVASIAVPVEASLPGSAGNVSAGTLTQITSTITGVDTVTNPAAMTGGIDSESDASLRSRFQLYILGLSRGDLYGVQYAIESLQTGVQYTVTENKSYDGSDHRGYFYVVIDDGSGSPSSDLLSTVTNAVAAVRPLGIMYNVYPTQLVSVTVSLLVGVLPGYDTQTVIAQLSAAIGNGINSLGLGAGLPATQISAWAYSVPGVSSISQVLINGVSGDAGSISADPRKTIKLVVSGPVIGVS